MRALFITHAGFCIGGGHLSRCFAISQALAERGVYSSWMLNREAEAQAVRFCLRDVFYFDDPFGGESPENDFTFAIIDSYRPPFSFYKAVSERMPIVVIDDLADRNLERCSKLVINYGVSACRDFDKLYKKESGARFLLGPQYTPLRRDYWNIHPSEGDYILFVPGAADVANASGWLAGQWRPGWPRLLVVLGPLVPDGRYGQIEASVPDGADVTLLSAPENFPAILANAGMVICSASVTAYEALAMGKRTAVFSVAANQEGLGEELSGMGVAFDLGKWQNVTMDKVAESLRFAPDADRLENQVDKKGALNCADEMIKMLNAL